MPEYFKTLNDAVIDTVGEIQANNKEYQELKDQSEENPIKMQAKNKITACYVRIQY